jgi:hypothetical protein
MDDFAWLTLDQSLNRGNVVYPWPTNTNIHVNLYWKVIFKRYTSRNRFQLNRLSDRSDGKGIPVRIRITFNSNYHKCITNRILQNNSIFHELKHLHDLVLHNEETDPFISSWSVFRECCMRSFCPPLSQLESLELATHFPLARPPANALCITSDYWLDQLTWGNEGNLPEASFE